MNLSKLSKLGLCLFSVLAMASCDDPEKITNATDVRQNGKNIEGILAGANGADGVLQIGASRSTSSLTPTYYAATGLIYDDVSAPPMLAVDGGAMVVGGITIACNTSNANVYGNEYQPMSTPPTFGGTSTFSLAGHTGNSIPSFSTTMYAPTVLTMAVTNAVGFTISKSNSLAITWNSDGSNPNGKVAIVLWYKGAQSNKRDTNLTATDSYYSYIVTDNGSYTISSTDLNSIPTGGIVDIAVGRANDKVVTASGKEYLCLAHTICREEYQVLP